MTSVRTRLGSAFLILVLALVDCAQKPAGTGHSAAPDLGLIWVDPEAARTATRQTSGTFEYHLYNQGDAAAHAVILEAYTALGPLRPPQRLEPGPRAGETLAREERLSIVDGMRELCVEVRLQTLVADAPPDRNQANNRICRSLDSTSPDTGASAPAATRQPVQSGQPAQTRQEAQSRTDPTETKGER